MFQNHKLFSYQLNHKTNKLFYYMKQIKMMVVLFGWPERYGRLKVRRSTEDTGSNGNF